MTQHTPGPWRAVSERLHDDKYHVAGLHPEIYAGERRIAGAYRISSPMGNNGKDQRAEANACLIAAAPDMLAALQAAEAGTNRWLQMVRTAIAKAREGATSD